VIAYWVPRASLSAGESRRLSYRLSTVNERLEHQSLAQVRRTLLGSGVMPGYDNPHDVWRFAIDFEGGGLPPLADDANEQVQLSTSSGGITDLDVQPLPAGAGWRAAFLLTPGERAGPSDMRLYLTLDGTRLTETWNYVWHPEDTH